MKYKLIFIITLISLSTCSLSSIGFCAGILKIFGTVYNDKNCNGERNGGDKGIGGVTLTLNPGAVVTVTNPGGNYKFENLSAGTYTVTETDPAGYCSTTPNMRTVILVKKNVHDQDFGDSKVSVSPPDESCCDDDDDDDDHDHDKDKDKKDKS